MAKKMAAKKKIPDCTSVGSSGTYHGNMMHPDQFDQLVSAIEGIKIDPSRVSLAFPDEFWLKFWAGCFAASGCMSLEIALRCADGLAAKIREGR